MRKLIISDAETMRIAVQQEINRSEDSRYDHRLHGVLLVCSGYSCYQVGQWLGHSPRTIEYWIKRFNQHGFAGLLDQPRAGRSSLLTEKIRRKLEKQLRNSPRNFGYHQNLWDGKLLSYHLAEYFQIQLSVRQCQRLFHQFGFRYRKPRPMIAQNDPDLEKAYKKTAPAGKKK